MLTKIIYFRPDKRFVNEDILDAKYSCVISDPYLGTETSITVPQYFSVFQHYAYDISKKAKLQNQQLSSTSSDAQRPQFLEKITFHLIGSRQVPSMSEYCQSVDRVEFHGHIGFEEPLFEIIQQLQKLRKVGFLLSSRKQGNFLQMSLADNMKENSCRRKEKNICSRSSVTNVKIVMERSPIIAQDDQDSVVNSSASKKETLRIMIIRFLRRIAEQCPHIKRLTIDVPNWRGIRKVVEEVFATLTHLKATQIQIINGRLVVGKSTDILSTLRVTYIPDDATPDLTTQPNESTKVTFVTNSKSDVECESHSIAIGTETENSGNFDKTLVAEELVPITLQDVPADDPEPANCLVDMSKLLGSMLGIPTSSETLPLSPTSPFPVIDIKPINRTEVEATTPESSTNPPELHSLDIVGQHKSVNHNMTSQLISNNKQNKLSTSTTEVISYAAAAAAATSTLASNNSNNSHCARGGNGNHQRFTSNSNEGSRRTFLSDREGSQNNEESTAHHRKPSIPHVADLGKPVFSGY